MGISSFTYNGITSTTYGIWIEKRPAVSFPKRVIESITIPGRSGALLFDTGSYDNVTVTYELAYQSNVVRDNAVDIATWLYQTDYRELTDTYEPSYYRKAILVSPITVNDILNVAGRVNATFQCMPQRYLLTGKNAITPTSGDTIQNDYQDALPIITVTGSGDSVLTVGNSVVTITGQTDDIILDSERQTAESNGSNANSLISLTNGFPVLVNGSNTISWTGGITGVSVVPNWWTL